MLWRGNLEFKEYDSLFVNLDRHIHPLSVLSEREGVEQMGRLIDESAIEEQWLFVPSQNKWYATGGKKKEFLVPEDTSEDWMYCSGVKTNVSLESRLFRQHTALIHYHIHPSEVIASKRLDELLPLWQSGNIPHLWQSLMIFIQMRSQATTAYYAVVQEAFKDMIAAAPSSEDFFELYAKSMRARRINPELVFSSKLRSEHGVTSYTLHNAIFKEHKKKHLPPFITQDAVVQESGGIIMIKDEYASIEFTPLVRWYERNPVRKAQ